MIVKVCGLREVDNIKDIVQLPIDYIGLIFYDKSPRFVEKVLDLPKDEHIKRVGVFVNASIDYIVQKIKDYQLDCVQLHGNESVEFCQQLLDTCHVSIVKAISVATKEDVRIAENYTSVADVLLFDTKVPTHGGSGEKFDWDIIHAYQGNKPFLLSGGISKDDVESIRNIKHEQFLGIDLNSKFEISAGYKNVQLLNDFVKAIKQ